MGLDDSDVFGDASGVCGELLVFGGDVFAWEGTFLGNGGGPIGVGIADRVEDAIVLATMVLQGSVIKYLLRSAPSGRGYGTDGGGCSV